MILVHLQYFMYLEVKNKKATDISTVGLNSGLSPMLVSACISYVFFYMKENLMKQKKLTAYETVIAINEFFDFNYDFVVKKVLSPVMIAEILEDYYENMGMASRIDEIAEEPLF